METSPGGADLRTAIEDLGSRTLAALPGELAKLIYLASTRDYNSGRYWHDGLARAFGPEVAEAALASCHRTSFRNLTRRPLEDLVRELEAYLQSTGEPAPEVVQTWKTLQPFRVAVPGGADDVTSEFFSSNVRVALEILQARQRDH